MKSKKIIMIALLVIFIAIIGVVITQINNKSVEKISETSQNANNTTVASSNAQTDNTNSNGIVRKSTEKVEADTNNMVEITDNYFIESTNDVYINLDDYIGKTIKMQGLVYNYEDSNGDICYAVVRNTPGCCGSDGLAGLDIRYDKDYPEVDTWVEVVGVVGKDTALGGEIPAIQVTSMTETEEGATFVTN